MPSVRLPLYYRLLFPDLVEARNRSGLIDAPPRITQSAKIDQELYTYLALIVRDFIQPWYLAITLDNGLPSEVTRIVTHCCREIELRCQKIDVVELILKSFPTLLTQHYLDYHQAVDKLHLNHGGGSATELESLFHGLQPHFAIEHEKEYVKQLSDHLLKSLLPKDEYDSDCVRYLVRDILNMVLTIIIARLSDPWTINTIVSKLLSHYDERLLKLQAPGEIWAPIQSDQPKEDTESKPISTTGGSTSIDPTGIVTSLQETQKTTLSPQLRHRHIHSRQNSDVQKQELTASPSPRRFTPLSTLEEQGDELAQATLPQPEKPPRRYSMRFISLQVILAPLQNMWFYIISLLTLSQERYQHVVRQRKKSRHVRLEDPVLRFTEVAFCVEDRPVVLWAWRMVGMFIWPIARILGGGVFTDKFLEQSVYHLLSEQRLVYYMQIGRETLWPGGKFVTAGTLPTEEEQNALRIQAERKLVLAIPDIVERVLFETSDINVHQQCMSQALAPLQNPYINKHLVFYMVDLIVSTVFPELAYNPVKAT
ncbi:hypothetical protein K450DRAFT_270399 [Umbelopsis ramanniana AG]|uniref:PXA domain-containing protein n=1 Tax=Umbelopsis ramanniana AG TaxID=1314678 RepID=A0AAD5ED50_UMBRA|nr:uncharacterized protein K450DRAFT_270399 [Umbelopsis ramanniana AG]KAI8581212.1 hypothetical protein K450DRAFT_270399 [Umbelopsis ramanniana AG]